MAINIEQILQQIQDATDEANRINEERYQQILGLFTGLGEAGRARIAQATARQQAEATQSLISRGLGGTTITEAARRGIASSAELARQQLEESVAMQKAGAIERRTDIGPDMGLYSSLLMAAGQAETATGEQATITRLGPMAAAGRSVFGTPFKYGGGADAGGGGGFAAGGMGGGAGGAGTIAGQAQYFGPGTGTAPAGMEGPITVQEGGVTRVAGEPPTEETYEQYRARVKMPVSAGYWEQFIKGKR